MSDKKNTEKDDEYNQEVQEENEREKDNKASKESKTESENEGIRISIDEISAELDELNEMSKFLNHQQ